MPKCQECGREFMTDAALSQHLKDKHGAGSAQAGARPEEGPRAVKKQKSLRRRNRHPVAVGVAAAAVVLVIGVYFVAAPSFAQPPFPCGSEGVYDHIHPYLQVWVEGKNVTLPADVGLLQGGSCAEPIHTHDTTGVLHLELSQSQAGRNWTLADFFSIWAYSCSQQASYCPTVDGTARPVVFNQTDILGFRADASHQVVLLVDGTASTQWGSLNLLAYDYCSAAVAAALPCSQSAGGDPRWECVTTTQCGAYPYGTGHKVVIEYT